MSCNPDNYNVPPPPFDEPSIPGFGKPTVPDASLPNIPQPIGFPEDLLEILERARLILPSGTFKPNLKPNVDRTFLDAIVKMLDLLLPFLAVYKFILPILQMIICIIEVLCALTNPFKLIRALRRLFRVCIPDFLALFPIFAIILMIISLILLIISLIEYIIAEIAKIIGQLLRNLILLGRQAARQDATGLLVAARKIGSLLCYLKNILSVLQVVALLIQVIQDILRLIFRIPPCDDNDNSDDGCCTPEVCPQFLKVETHEGTLGSFQYLSRIDIDTSGLGFPSYIANALASSAPVREESWQFYDATRTGTNAFYNITSADDVDPNLGFTFFPQGKTYNETSNLINVPYTLDMRFFYDPVLFGRIDVLGARFVRVKNCIVFKTPSLSLKNWENLDIGPNNGVMNIFGGKAFEDDGVTQITIDARHATLTTLIRNPAVNAGPSNLPINNPLFFDNITYTLKINHAVLVSESMITLGCVPSVALDKNAVNANFAGPELPDPSGPASRLPDAGKAQQCLDTALTQFAQEVTAANAAAFQQQTTACLNTLLEEAKNSLVEFTDLGVTTNKSDFTISPKIQFTSGSIKVTATLKDNNGFNICQNFPVDVAAQIAQKIVPDATFGNVTPFTYDGTTNFTADITSDESGTGEIKVKYNNNYFNTVTVPAALNLPITVELKSLDYEFIKTVTDATVTADGTILDGKIRRDERDTAQDGKE